MTRTSKDRSVETHKYYFIFTTKYTFIVFDGENIIKTTKMLIQDYASYSNPKMKIGRLVKEGKLIPIIQGIYETDKSIPGYYLSGIIYDPSYLSFEFALSWYGFIPETVYNYTSASYSKKKKKEYDTYFGRFTYRDVPTSVYPYGTKIIEENGYGFIIASEEKAICDELYKCSPCSNKKELCALLFEDLRLDENTFWNADLDMMIELASLYKNKNHHLLISLIKDKKNMDIIEKGPRNKQGTLYNLSVCLFGTGV